jgi:serine protease Do
MRRSLFIFLLAALIAFGIYRWLQLDHRLHTHPVAERYTPADGTKIDPKDVPVLSALDAEYTRLVRAVVPSVVSITSSRQVSAEIPDPKNPFAFLFPNAPPSKPKEQVQLGSGVIVSQEGHILTNRHVIANMEKVEVQLTDGRILPAQLIGSDEQTDIAILKITADKIEPLRLGDSDEVHVGQLVFAVGNPFGLQETVTQGIVSAKSRRAMQDSGVEFFQTDAAVNQGNSGGPLLNVRGEVIGINSAIFSNTEEGSWTGISFATPSNVARRDLESLLKTGRIVRGFLGVTVVDIKNLPPQGKQMLHLSDKEEGVVVARVVPGSPADKAGLKPGDMILRFNGRAVPDKIFFRSRVAEVDLHTKVQLTILREGQEQTLTVEIIEAPAGLDYSPTQVPPP